MRIVSVGAGPAALYFSILMKQSHPDVSITLYEQNAADATFGWGVVFSDETLGHFEQADPVSYAAITEAFAYWTDIDTYVHDQLVRSTGHGFCGMSRAGLLRLFRERCLELGVEIHYDHAIEDPRELATSCDLLLGADGLRSVVRGAWEDAFEPSLDWRTCRFTWLGTTLPLEAFTFIFRESEHGLFQVHAYPFEEGLSTFIVECHDDTWHRAGLDKASEEETVAYVEALVRRPSAGPPDPDEQVHLAALPYRALPALASRPHRASGRCRPHRPLQHRLGHQAGHGGRDRSARGFPCPWNGGRPEGTGCLRGDTTRGCPQDPEGGADQPRVVREQRALPAPGSRDVHVQPDVP